MVVRRTPPECLDFRNKSRPGWLMLAASNILSVQIDSPIAC
ncbi:hypothetical protein OROMI_008903 [Orobanche minor]